MPYYEFILIVSFWNWYKSLFKFEHSILKHPSWASIAVLYHPYLFLKPPMVGTLMKIYCTSRRGLHIAFSDDWIENRSLAIALLKPTAGILQTDRMILLIVCPFPYPSLHAPDLPPQTQQFKPLDRYRHSSIPFPFYFKTTSANCFSLLSPFYQNVEERFYVILSTYVKIQDILSLSNIFIQHLSIRI